MTTQVIYSKRFDRHDNKRHPENSNRTKIMMDELKKSAIFKEIELIEPDQLIEEKKLHNVHSERMIDDIKIRSKIDESWIDPDTYVSKNDFETASLAAGTVLSACKDVIKGKIENAFCLVRPPGHHATSEKSMGFCLFNNAAIAANETTKKGKKVLIFDPDCHHGNGTQDIFYDRSDVLYQSLHLSPHYPGTGDVEEIGEGKGKGYSINAPLPHFYGNNAANQILDEIFLPVAEKFKPDLIIFSTGYDSHHSDSLGGLSYTANYYGELIEKYQNIQSKIVCTLEGGYNPLWIGKCFVSQVSQMSHQRINFNDKISSKSNIDSLKKDIKKKIGKFWDI